jgi:hypothetical protein
MSAHDYFEGLYILAKSSTLKSELWKLRKAPKRMRRFAVSTSIQWSMTDTARGVLSHFDVAPYAYLFGRRDADTPFAFIDINNAAVRNRADFGG